MPSTDAVYVLATRKQARTLAERALAVGLNVDLREISGAPLLPFEVTLHGHHEEPIEPLLDGLQVEVVSFVHDPR